MFKSREYLDILGRCLDGTSFEHQPIYEQWALTKQQMIVAAELARNELQAKGAARDSEIGAKATLLTCNSVARAIWRQDRRLAQRLSDETTIGAAELRIHNGEVRLTDAAVSRS